MRAAVRALVRPVLHPRVPRARAAPLAGSGHRAHAAAAGRRRAHRHPGRTPGRGARAARRRPRTHGAAPARRRVHGRLAGHPPRAGRPPGRRDAARRCTCWTTGSRPSTPSRRRSTTPGRPGGELLARGADPAATALTGDSAGGWLALTTALRLRDAGEPLPAVLGLISPWLDLTGASWPDRAHRRDAAAGLAAPVCRRRSRRRPEAAPLAADLAGLPPMVVQVGSEEILLPDAVALARARAGGGRAGRPAPARRPVARRARLGRAGRRVDRRGARPRRRPGRSAGSTRSAAASSVAVRSRPRPRQWLGRGRRRASAR